MKFVKGIGLFFIYPLTMLAIGFYAGAWTFRYFYPGAVQPDRSVQEAAPVPEPDKDMQEEALYAASSSETLYVGTEYVLEETDILHHTVVETTWRLPDKYVGMNREQFIAAMDIYAASPPLSEQERGFVGLEVLAFSRERVVIQMNYRYIQPSSVFYLAAYDNKVLVYLEDRETVYIETEIRLDSLPEEMQQEVMQMLRVESEEELYGFLETYSS